MIQVLKNIQTLVVCPADGGHDALGAIDDAALVSDGETICWVGQAADLPESYRTAQQLDARRALVIPGLIDCHTHLAFGGWRADEFELRCKGASYVEIARAGGGIQSTVRQTRNVSGEALFKSAHYAADQMLQLGVTTIECKSGYGLTIQDELKLLKTYQRLAAAGPQRFVATLLGAHVVPPEFVDDRQAYLDLVSEELIPQVAESGLAEFNDVFVEEGAFSIDEARQVLEAGNRYGLRAKLHADQLHDGHAALLAAEVGAVSADHLEHTSDDGMERMSAAGAVAVALPFASLTLRQPPLDARRWFERDVPVAVATDFNPGTAPSYHLPLAMTLACMMNHMSPAEALRGATINAARAINGQLTLGSLEVGKQADFVLLRSPSVNQWLYHFRPNDAAAVFIGGQQVTGEP